MLERRSVYTKSGDIEKIKLRSKVSIDRLAKIKMQTITLDSPSEIPNNDLSKHTAGLLWQKWIQAFEHFLVASAIKDKMQMKAMLLHEVGPEVREIYHSLQETTDNYEAVKIELNNFLKKRGRCCTDNIECINICP